MSDVGRKTPKSTSAGERVATQRLLCSPAPHPFLPLPSQLIYPSSEDSLTVPRGWLKCLGVGCEVIFNEGKNPVSTMLPIVWPCLDNTGWVLAAGSLRTGSKACLGQQEERRMGRGNGTEPGSNGWGKV